MADSKITEEELLACLKQGMSVLDIAAKYSLHPRSVRKRKARLAAKGLASDCGLTH